MSENEFKSCYKCGKIGHLASECKETNVISEINSFENKIQNKISQIFTDALEDQNFQKDEFGPFLPNPPAEKNVGHNWSNEKFCFNCGESGHSEENCPYPPFESFCKNIQKSMEETPEDPSRIKQVFEQFWVKP